MHKYINHFNVRCLHAGIVEKYCTKTGHLRIPQNILNKNKLKQTVASLGRLFQIYLLTSKIKKKTSAKFSKIFLKNTQQKLQKHNWHETPTGSSTVQWSTEQFTIIFQPIYLWPHFYGRAIKVYASCIRYSAFSVYYDTL